MRGPVAASMVFAAVALAGCDLFDAPASGGATVGAEPPAPGPASTFAYRASQDISGYYRPSIMIGADDFELIQVFVGQPPEFEAWGRGDRNGIFAPVMMEFSALGGQTIRVLPERYLVSDERITMQGTAQGAGPVSMDVRLDTEALASARRNLGDSEAPAMTGTVRVGPQIVSGVKFSWYGGD